MSFFSVSPRFRSWKWWILGGFFAGIIILISIIFLFHWNQIIELYAKSLIYQFIPPKIQSVDSTVTPKILNRSMQQGADWIAEMQQPDGRFLYWHNPQERSTSTSSDDNFLRQAGTAFSLTLVYDLTKDPRHLDAAQKSIRYLLQFRQDLDTDKAYFLAEEKAKLGGIALPLLAMLKLRQLIHSEEYDPLLKKLSQMILFLQQKYTTGQYKSTYVYAGNYDYEASSGWQSQIYPGEALYALSSMFKTFGNPEYHQSIDRALSFYLDSGKWNWKNYAFLPWTLSALTVMFDVTGDVRYAEKAYLLADHLIGEQNLDSQLESYGSFHAIPSANTGSYLEGLADVVHLAKMHGDTKRQKRYAERVKIGYFWLLKLQIHEDLSHDFNEPQKALGGFRRDLESFELRIDYTQHIISSFSKGLHVIYSQ